MASRAVIDLGSVLVLVNDLHRHEPLAGVGQGHLTGPAPRSKTAAELERIAIGADDGLLVDGRRFPAVSEPAKASVFHDVSKIEVALGSGKVVGRDGNSRGGRLGLGR